jgi:hypothetical protein
MSNSEEAWAAAKELNRTKMWGMTVELEKGKADFGRSVSPCCSSIRRSLDRDVLPERFGVLTQRRRSETGEQRKQRRKRQLERFRLQEEERRREEEKLKAELEELRRLLLSSPPQIWENHIDPVFQYQNGYFIPVIPQPQNLNSHGLVNIGQPFWPHQSCCVGSSLGNMPNRFTVTRPGGPCLNQTMISDPVAARPDMTPQNVAQLQPQQVAATQNYSTAIIESKPRNPAQVMKQIR